MRNLKYLEDILQICTNNHLTVEEILLKMKQKHPKIGIATIYRNVNFLVKQGKMRKIDNINQTTYYETISKPHIHFIDEETGEIIDIPEEIINLNKHIFDKISDIRIYGKLKK